MAVHEVVDEFDREVQRTVGQAQLLGNSARPVDEVTPGGINISVVAALQSIV